VIAFAAVTIGLLLGSACGGSVRGLEAVGLRHELPVLILFVVQGVARGRIAGTTASTVGTAVWVCSCIALVVVLAPDWRRPGVWIVCVGMGLNLLVVLVNGGMPILLEGKELVSASVSTISESMGFYQIAGPGTVVAALGDVVLLAVGGYRVLVSCGDILLVVGVSLFVADAMIGFGVAQRGYLGN